MQKSCGKLFHGIQLVTVGKGVKYMKKRKRGYFQNSAQYDNQGIIGTINAQRYPKDKCYRHQFSNFVGQKKMITGTLELIKRKKIKGEWTDAVLIKNVFVLDTNKMCYARHLWITSKRKLLQDNSFKIGDNLFAEGEFYEYVRANAHNQKTRNVGFRFKKAYCKNSEMITATQNSGMSFLAKAEILRSSLRNTSTVNTKEQLSQSV